MMARKDITILLDLQDFFSDDRQRSKILVSQKSTKIADLEDKISQVFGIKRFHLLSDGCFLPSCEDIAIIKNGETVCVKPTLNPSYSVLLSSEHYNTHTISNNEKKSNVTKCNKHNETEFSPSYSKNRKQGLKGIKNRLHASTPVDSNTLSPEPQIDKEYKIIPEEAIIKKEKSKLKNDKYEEKPKKRKNKVLNECETSIVDNSIDETKFEEKYRRKTKKRKIDITKQEEIAENCSLNSEYDQTIKKSRLTECDKTAAEINEEQSITDKTEFISKPLPHKKAREGNTWSSEPLPKTTNLVKITKVPIEAIEIDYSRFDFSPDDNFQMETSEMKNLNKNSLVNDVSNQQTYISDNKKTENIDSSLIIQNTSEPSHNCLQEKIRISTNSSECDEDPSKTNIVSENLNNSETSKVLFTSTCDIQIEKQAVTDSISDKSHENSQDDESESKNKARVLWRQKISKIAESSDPSSTSESNTNCAKSNIDTEGNHKSNSRIDENFSLLVEDTLKLDGKTTSSLYIEEDSLQSFTTVTDSGSYAEPKRKRKRTHRKKNKNEISKVIREEPRNNCAKYIPLVSAKPKIHIKFEESDEESLKEKITPNNRIQAENEEADVKEKVRIFQNVKLTPDKLVEQSQEILPKPAVDENIAECPSSPKSNQKTEENFDETTFQSLISKLQKDTSNNEDLNKLLFKIKNELLQTVDAMNQSN